jgi:hypothetical protein
MKRGTYADSAKRSVPLRQRKEIQTVLRSATASAIANIDGIESKCRCYCILPPALRGAWNFAGCGGSDEESFPSVGAFVTNLRSQARVRQDFVVRVQAPQFRSNYLRVFIYSAIALAWSSVIPAMPLLCGALLVDSPLVMCATSSSEPSFVPLTAGAFIADLPSPLAP